MSVKAVILCGGQGTRIREASEVLPKPMLPIGGRLRAMLRTIHAAPASAASSCAHAA